MKRPQWFDQLVLLLWKNTKLQSRSVKSTFLEIAVPALFAIILLPIRTIVNSDQYKNNTLYPAFSVDKFPDDLQPKFSEFRSRFFTFQNRKSNGWSWPLAYSPNTTKINLIMSKVAKDLDLQLKPFLDEESMLTYLADPLVMKITLGGVTFLNESSSNFTYKIRLPHSPINSQENGLFKKDLDWKTNLIYPILPVLGPREKSKIDGGDPGYFREGFIQLQKAIDFALIGLTNSSVNTIDLNLKRFPYPPYNDDKFVVIIAALFPFIIVISFVFTVILTAKAIVYEKETGLKEAMKLMGMKTWVYWLSWYIKTFILLLPSLIFMIVSYKVKVNLKNGGQASIIDQTDPFLFAIFMLLYASSTITFTFLTTTFFKKANSAAAGAGVIWFLSYLPYIFISLRYEKMNLFEKLIACFVNNLALSEGIQLISMFEGKGEGINFSNWTTSFSVDDNFSLFQVMIIMFFNNFIHLLLTYYFENVLPGIHGIAKPWHFPISRFFSKSKKDNSESVGYSNQLYEETTHNGSINTTYIKNDTDIIRDVHSQVHIEDESIYSSRSIGIRITNLVKKFKQLGQIKKAVKNLSLNIYEGQISVLLGHNGAGKSTTISMITGLCEPTSGNILINDKDIVENTNEARSVLGYCPQHNLLFDDLTVYEHLKFFSKLKQNFDDNEIDNMLELINLSDKKHALSKTLSGGMKRKLSVAIAFIGGSKIVILDEPSSGMDPQARHSTWSLLKKFKNERKCTILLTTHFMDEADYLGDRIAIMSKGSLRCCGSPLYLKSKYGSGYSLVITRKKRTNSQLENASSNPEASDDHITNKIIGLVLNTIPNSKLSSNINTEISFVLPSKEANRFPILFDLLDEQKDDLRILNIGISVTTVEEVFLKISDEENVEETDETKSVEISQPNDVNLTDYLCAEEDQGNFGLWVGSNNEDTIDGPLLLIQQFQALLIKRMINSLRNKILIVSQLIIPIAILIINLVYLKYAPIKNEESPMLKMTIEKYGLNYVPYNLVDKDNQLLADISKSYLQQFNSNKNTHAFELNDNNTIKKCIDFRQDIDSYLGCMGSLNVFYIIDQYVVASTFGNKSKNTIFAHFNNQPYHAPALTLNLMSNAMLKLFGSSNDTITVYNHPLPRTVQDEATDLQFKSITGFNVASGLTFGFSFLIASFAIFLIRERVSDAKHLQYMSGCNTHVFWIATFFWDMVNYIVPVIFVLLLLKAFGIEEFVGGNRWGYVFSILIMYGMAHIPQMYLFSNYFKVSATGMAALTAFNILTSQATLTPTAILTLPQLDLVDVSKILEWIFIVIFPNFAFGQGLIDLYNNYQTTSICKSAQELCPYFKNQCCLYYNTSDPTRCGNSSCLLWTENYMSWEQPGLLRFFVFMPLQFIIYFGFILLYEAGVFRELSYKFNSLFEIKKTEINYTQLEEEQLYDDIPKDRDVLDEENRIANINIYQNNPEIFIVDRLTKYYADFMAVKGISFTISNSECFGLLGVNGAGKTSTFKMITGDEFITKGEAYLNRINIKNDIKRFQRQLGYCPQFDPLIDQMTVLETMFMYSRLRGIRNDLILKTCLSLIDLLDLNDHIDKMCYTLSGGNKRKLSVAIALVGSPTIILLDEPTSGMDPKTRRTLWNCLNKIRNKGKSLILTTHSMDETEALCTNIGIMVNGELKCMGSLQHLKSRYGDGYTLLAKIALDENGSDETKSIQFIEFIKSTFENVILKENRDGFVNIQIQNNSTSALSSIFSQIETNKEKFSIEYYVVTQTKLEQIFLNFASKQIDPESRILHKKNLFSRICC